jgi:hypothetical protein
MTPIEQCAICVQLEQRLELNHEEHQVRPAALDALVQLAHRREDSSEPSDDSWWEEQALRCPTCGTVYRDFHSVDPGHSFMDPTHDTESIARLSVRSARDFLAKFATPEAGVAADELGAREAQLVDELSTLLATPGRAPGWHVQRQAIECLLDAFLSVRDFERLDRLLLRHEDPVVRVEAGRTLVTEAYYLNGWRAPLAQEVISSLVLPSLASVLATSARQTWSFSRDFHAWRPETTLNAATQAVGVAVDHDVRIEDALVDRFVELLGEATESWLAADTLMSVMRKSSARARRLLPVLRELPGATINPERLRSLRATAEREAAKADDEADGRSPR